MSQTLLKISDFKEEDLIGFVPRKECTDMIYSLRTSGIKCISIYIKKHTRYPKTLRYGNKVIGIVAYNIFDPSIAFLAGLVSTEFEGSIKKCVREFFKFSLQYLKDCPAGEIQVHIKKDFKQAARFAQAHGFEKRKEILGLMVDGSDGYIYSRINK